MMATFLIMFREGIEAALIVGIIANYLKLTGRSNLMKAVWAGVILATLLCLGLALAIQITNSEFPQKQQELVEGVISVLAVGMLTWMVFWMRKAARSIKDELHSQIETAILRSDKWGLALVGMSFLAVVREGLETIVFLLASFQQNTGIGTPLGALLGYIAAIIFGILIYQGGVRLNFKRFFKWTGFFIILVAAGLSAGVLKHFHEAGIWNYLQTIVFDASRILSAHGVIGEILVGIFGYNEAPTLGEVIVYFGYLIPTTIFFFWSGGVKPAPAKNS